MSGLSRSRALSVGVAILVVAVIVAAFALGGRNGLPKAQRGAVAISNSGDVAIAPAPSGIPETAQGSASAGKAPSTYAVAGGTTAGRTGSGGSTAVSTSGADSAAGVNDAVSTGGGVAATRVVKTGSLSLTVKKGQVAATITELTKATTSLGGYVSQSRTDDVDGSPAGSLTLRIPVGSFDDAVAAAAKLGTETALSTNAHDVTGKFVDLSARLSALKRTRSTYLTILSRARTIGQTLSVQQRVNDIQQQIESLQGQLKVLRNQSSDGTLTVDVSEVGAAVVTTPMHHHRSGFSKAWHTSTSRFNRGIQAIIGGLGPLLLALILLGLVYVIARLSFRRVRRVTS